MNPSNQMQKLFLLHVLGELSAEQAKELWAWRRISTENETLFQEAVDWDGIRRGIRRMMESKAVIFKKIQQDYPMHKPIPSIGNRFAKINWKIAAVVGLAIVLVGGLLMILNNEQLIRPGKQQAFYVDAQGRIYNTDNLRGGTLIAIPGGSTQGSAQWRDGPRGEKSFFGAGFRNPETDNSTWSPVRPGASRNHGCLAQCIH